MPSMMIVPENVPSEGEDCGFSLSVEEFDDLLVAGAVSGVRGAGAAVAELRAMPSGEDLFVVGRVWGRVQYVCGRCLVPFEEDVEFPVHLTFARPEEAAAGEVELHAEDLEVESYGGGPLDLVKVVVDQFFLGLKAYPICRGDCKGLCARCGVDRNTEECSCPPDLPDPRLAVLASWGKRVHESP